MMDGGSLIVVLMIVVMVVMCGGMIGGMMIGRLRRRRGHGDREAGERRITQT